MTPRISRYRHALAEPVRGTALLSYLSEPFLQPDDRPRRQDYSNTLMALEIGNALNREGFEVDVINYDDYRYQPDKSYDILVGAGANYARLASVAARRIYWATRSDPGFEIEAVRQRQVALLQRRGAWIPNPEAWPTLLESPDYAHAEAVLLLGNRQTRATYRHDRDAVHCLNNVALAGEEREPRSPDRRHFLFMSSWLLVHKGLDLVLEAFAARPQCTLWICAPVESEPLLAKLYRRELFQTDNIKCLGWLGVQTREFATVAARCAYQVFPGSAEGMSGSVLNGMARGLVPLATRTAGVDLDGHGVEITEATPHGVGDAIDRAIALPDAEWRQRAASATTAARLRYSIEHFRTSLAKTLRAALTDAPAQ